MDGWYGMVCRVMALGLSTCCSFLEWRCCGGCGMEKERRIVSVWFLELQP
jgi:hypothetical protein